MLLIMTILCKSRSENNMEDLVAFKVLRLIDLSGQYGILGLINFTTGGKIIAKSRKMTVKDGDFGCLWAF